MCGFSGLFDLNASLNHPELNNLIERMNNTIAHRGPDAGLVWSDAEVGVALGHRRLSIIDLSEAGNQPMTSASGRFVMVYNGEVYNAEDLRPELSAKGIDFRGHSDTEVMLEGFAEWGVEATVKRLIGMFTLCLWDRKERKLWLVRDRLGIKPLYWTITDKNQLLFGSELKVLRAHPDCSKEINRNALSGYLRHNYIAAPNSIYDNVHKMDAGTILSISADDFEPKISKFWSMDDVVSQSQTHPFTGSDSEALASLDELLSDAVKRRMVADVPLGAFLSGGIDSSLVVALMQSQSERPVKSFSIGFNEEGYNEAKHAKAVANHLKTEHTELYVTPEEAREVIPKLPFYYDEPFSDSSQIPTYLVSAMTREHVTVALSGDGGDELFAGYNRYFQAENIGKKLGKVPGFVKDLMSAGIKSMSPNTWDQLFKVVPASKRPPQAGDKLYKLADVLNTDEDGFYRQLISHWGSPDDIVIGGSEPRGVIWDDSLKSRIPNFTSRMQYLDTCTYLPDDILTKVDRASMAVALEARVPILDHRVVEFAWSLPHQMKIRDGQGKWLLRQLLYKHVPQSLIDRPKMGFGVPIGEWLRGPLKEWANDLLSDSRIKSQGLLHSAPIQEKWREHLSGSRNWQYYLWDILMLQAWLDENGY